MTAVAVRTRAAKAKPTPVVSAPSAPPGKVVAADFDIDAATIVLQRAASISYFLVSLFEGGSGPAGHEVRALMGLMGTVQHLRRILTNLEAEVMEVEGDLPEFFREHLTEASHMATLLDEVEWLSGYSFRLGNGVLYSYFDSICAACEAAELTLSAPGEHA